MTDEPNTSQESETDNVNPEQTDTAEDWNYFDPDEDTEESPTPEATDDGTEEIASDETEAEAEEAPATVEFTLQDGTKVDKDELVRGYQRQADYTRKTQEVANLRQSLTERTAEIDGIVSSVTEYLKTLMPPAPDPTLAMRDPNAYIRAKAQHEAAVAKVNELVEIGGKPKAVSAAISNEEQQARFAEANRKLIAMFPQAGTQEGRPKFLEGVTNAAKNAGFTMAELQKVDDPRMFALAHYANIGMRAQEAAKTVREKAKATPSPTKPGASSVAKNSNADAMRRLAKVGSIKAAMAVDFD